jgi:iron complex outermembrane recepter protein
MSNRTKVGLAVVVALYGPLCLAQEVPAGDQKATQPNADTLDVIVVTAERREENIHDVPMQVTAISGEKLEREGATSLLDVVEHSPAVTYQEVADPRTTTLSIRGISTLGNVPGVEPSAAIVVDGETLARNAELMNDLDDVSRMEILEGPQGTLFGKNAVAGILNIITRAPSLTDGFSMRLNAGAAANNRYTAKAGFNIPVSDTAAFYVNGFYNTSGGWVQNANSNEPNGGNGNAYGARVQFLVMPNDRISLLLRAETSEQHDYMSPAVLLNLSQADLETAALLDGNGPNNLAQYERMVAVSGITLPLVNNTRSYFLNDRTLDEMHNTGVSAQLKYNYDTATLIYQGSYRRWALNSNDNEMGLPLELSPYMYAGPTIEKTDQQELRIESKGDTRLKYVGGLFYYENNNFRRELDEECNNAIYGDYNSPSGDGYYSAIPSLAGFNCTGGGTTTSYDIIDYQTTVETHNEAVFGQLDYDLLTNLSVFAGARALWEQQKMTYGTLPDATLGPFYPTPFSANSSDHALIDREGIKYKLGPALLYVTHTTGYKGVAWDNAEQRNVNEFVGPGATSPVHAERPTQFEAGFRLDMLDGKVFLGVTGYDLRDHHYQARTTWYDPAYVLKSTQRVIDGGTAGSDGAEVQLDIKPTNHWAFGLGYNHLNARFLDHVYIPCAPGAQCIEYGGKKVSDGQGQPLPQAPKDSADAYGQYNFKIDSTMASYLRLEYRYRSMQTNTLSVDPLQNQPSYGIYDLYLDVASPSGRAGITFYVKNLTNHFYYLRPFEPAAFGWTAGQEAVLPSDYTRYIGVRARYDF